MSDHYSDLRNVENAVVEHVDLRNVQVTEQPIKSDGGSTSYYQLDVPDRVVEQIRDGDIFPTIETGDVIEMLVDNDFDMGNIIKALRRINEAKKGKGKAGTDIAYDIKKCHYFLDQIAVKAGI